MKHLILLILILVAISLCVTIPTIIPTVPTGYLIIGIKDKMISGENVTAITLTIKSVQIHYSGPEEKIEIEVEIKDNESEIEVEWDDNETEFSLNTTDRSEIIPEIVSRTGLNIADVEKYIVFKNETSEVEESEETEIENKSWTTVFEGSKTFNLLEYTGNIVGILGENNITPGKYEQIRLYISNATITVDNITYPLTIPSNVLKIVEGFQVEANKTLILTLDFDVEHSIKKEAKGYKLKPVIKLLETETEEIEHEEIERETGEELEEIEED